MMKPAGYANRRLLDLWTFPPPLLLVMLCTALVVTPSSCWLCHNPVGEPCGPLDHCAKPSCGPSSEDHVAATELDACGCCPVCKRGLHDVCGGRNNVLGKCADNLMCVLPPQEDGYQFTGLEQGTCQDGTSLCKDLKRYQGYIVVDGRCASVTVDACAQVTFPYVKYDECKMALASGSGLVPQLKNDTALKHPNCSNVVCQSDDVICPSDSYKIPVRSSLADPCCSTPQECACLPKACDDAVTCPAGMQAKIVQHGNGKPGSCCNTYKCVNDTELMCTANNRHYKNGEEWQIDCSTCVCHDGLVMCQPIQCSTSGECGHMVIPKGECCPVCRGCVSPSGHLYNDSNVWKEDDCTTCTCVKGRTECQAEMCQVNCLHPTKIPGQCCPVCEEDAKPCSGLVNCTLSCKTGFLKDSFGCDICTCAEIENCDLECSNGYKRESNGHPKCECNPPKCPPMDKCKKECPNGFRVDRDGCERCKCLKCSERRTACRKACSQGFVLDEHGCPLCRCIGASSPGSHPASLLTCRSPDGKLHPNGESWRTGPCESCTCRHGVTHCYHQKCPALKCTRLLHLKDRCCPLCLDERPSPLQDKCEHRNVLYESGEAWKVGDCVQCVCLSGHKSCTEQSCQHACQNPVKIQGQCCPVCADSSGSSNLSGILAALVVICIILAVLLLAIILLVIFLLKHRNASGFVLPHSCPWRTTPTCPKSTQLDYRASFYDYNEAAGVKPVAL